MSVIPQGGPPSKAGQPRIRPASLADVPDLVALMGAFYAESGYPLPVSQATRTFERLLSQPAHGAVWLMVADRQPAGFVVLTVAFSMEYVEGIEFSAGGLSNPDDPAITMKDMTGALRAWIEVGTPDADRLHRASKAAPRVAVYVHRDPGQFLARLAGERIHRSEALEIWGMDQALIQQLVARLERRMSLSVSITDRELYISTGVESFTGQVRRCVIER